MMTRKKHKNLEQRESATDEYSADGDAEQDLTLMDGVRTVNATPSMDNTPSPQVRGSGTSIKSIRSTPVTRRRSSSFKINRTLNVTNLNILFDSSHINQGFSPRDRVMVQNNCRTTATEPSYETPKGWSKKKLTRTTPNININPYVKDSAIKKYTKNSNRSLEKSLGELSFFAPNLYNWKSASTPIVHKLTATDLRNSPIFNSNDLRKPDRNHSNNTSAVRKPLEELDADLFIDKKNNIAGNGGIAGPQQQQQRQRGYEYVVDRIKKCGENSIKWSWLLIDFLRKQVGTALWNPDHDTSSCDCSNHLQQKTEVDELSSKVEELTRELGKVKTELQSQKSDANRIVNISTEMTEIRTGLVKIDEIFKQLEFLKGHLMTGAPVHRGFGPSAVPEVPAAGAVPQPPPPPPPPGPIAPAPPPPPPPPPMPELTATPVLPPLFLRKTSKNKEGKKSGKENMRPIISLDDILKVKLKKTAERPGPARRSSQPVISQDMLKQVKLKPPSLRSTTGTPATLLHSQSLDVSPRTSLNRILSCDNPSVHKTESSTETDGPPAGEDLTVDPDDDDEDDDDYVVPLTILERYSTSSVESHGKSRDHHHRHGKKSKTSNSVTLLKEKIEENCFSNT